MPHSSAKSNIVWTMLHYNSNTLCILTKQSFRLIIWALKDCLPKRRSCHPSCETFEDRAEMLWESALCDNFRSSSSYTLTNRQGALQCNSCSIGGRSSSSTSSSQLKGAELLYWNRIGGHTAKSIMNSYKDRMIDNSQEILKPWGCRWLWITQKKCSKKHFLSLHHTGMLKNYHAVHHICLDRDRKLIFKLEKMVSVSRKVFVVSTTGILAMAIATRALSMSPL